MSTFFEYEFIQRALIGGAMISLLAGYFGVFTVQRSMSFAGTGLAHAAFGGVALGLFLDIEPLLTAAVVTVLAAWLLNIIKDGSVLEVDTAVGILFAVTMAGGIIFLSLRESYSGEVNAYLFGSILAVTSSDLISAGALLILSVLLLPLWGRWAYATFDRDLAISDKVPVKTDDMLLTGALALTVVVSLKMVGMVLITAFLVIPPAAAALISRRFAVMTVLSLIISFVSVLSGILLSYLLDMPSGAVIVLVQAVVFALFFMLKRSTS